MGKYVLVLQYYYPSDRKTKLNVYLRYPKGSQRGEVNLQSCSYRFGCRQVTVDRTGAVKVFDVAELQRTVVTLLARDTSSPIALVCMNGGLILVKLDIFNKDDFQFQMYDMIFGKVVLCSISKQTKIILQCLILVRYISFSFDKTNSMSNCTLLF